MRQILPSGLEQEAEAPAFGQTQNRWMSLDFGDRTVGVAMTDLTGTLASPVETIWRKEPDHLRQTLARIVALINEHGIKEVFLGCPYHLDGSSGLRVEKTLDFARRLARRADMPVYLVDERLTTVEADEILADCGVRPENRKASIDQIAAVLILESVMKA